MWEKHVALVFGAMLVFLGLGTASKTFAQSGPTHHGRGSDTHIRHVTADLIRASDYSRVQAHIKRLRKQAVRPKTRLDTDTRTFRVRNILDQSEWADVEARRLASTPETNVWMEVAEANRFRRRGILGSVVQQIQTTLSYRTSVASLDSTLGVLSLLHRYFGHPPDVDRDGRVDILLLDIHDQFEETGAFVAGFFDPNDLTSNANSNRRDLLYIDTRPTILRDGSVDVSTATATIAHEYQHLVHANYEGREVETTFVNEGLSELAEIVCGFEPRSAGAYFADPVRPLFSWSYGNPLPDYARASLFLHYLAEQIGYEHVSDLVQTPNRHGERAVRAVLQQTNAGRFEEVFEDWGQATLLAAPDSRVGYRHPDRVAVGKGAPGVEIRTLPELRNGELGAWSHGRFDVPLVRDATVHIRSQAAVQLHGQVVHPSGRSRSVQMQSGQKIRVDDGGQATLQVLVSNVESGPDSSMPRVQVVFNGRRSLTQTTLRHDDGVADAFGLGARYLLLERAHEQAGLKFDPLTEFWMRSIDLDVVFLSEIEGSGISNQTPKRLEVEIRSVEDGLPGARVAGPETFEITREEGQIGSVTVSLGRFYDQLSQMNEPVYVLIGSGLDSNPVAIALDNSPSDAKVRGVHHRGGWRPMAHVRVDGQSLEGYRPMIRANVAWPNRRDAFSRLNIQPVYHGDHIWVSVSSDVEMKPETSRIVAQMPSGRYLQALTPIPMDSLEADVREAVPPNAGAIFNFPVETGGPYVLHARVETVDYGILKTGVRWQGPDLSSAEVRSPYPNPTRQSATLPIVLREPADVRVSLFDVLGRRVRKHPSRRTNVGSFALPIDLRSLASGMYFVRVTMRRLRDGHTTRDVRKVVLIR
ncbi:T9SS type A sorting domain-containing protein [Longibacter salinarum]|nr:T9SS type A sorting domain-containing protein [Longibacter salinarum]